MPKLSVVTDTSLWVAVVDLVRVPVVVLVRTPEPMMSAPACRSRVPLLVTDVSTSLSSSDWYGVPSSSTSVTVPLLTRPRVPDRNRP